MRTSWRKNVTANLFERHIKPVFLGQSRRDWLNAKADSLRE